MKEEQEEALKVLRVRASYHMRAKIGAAMQDMRMQAYIESLIDAAEEGRIIPRETNEGEDTGEESV